VAKVVEAIKLKNTDTDSQLGIRIATITYIDTVGAMADKLMASVLSCLPNTTYDLPAFNFRC
jgi:hypothetical protein